MADRQMDKRVSRRRFLRLTAVAAGLAAMPGSGAATEGVLTSWRGVTLGALTRIDIRHPDRRRAEAALHAAVREAERLEALFSLYRQDSALVRLNAAGRLAAAPTDMVRLLSEARVMGDLTGGAFDVSVQPLWQAHAAHFSAPAPDDAGPHRDALRRALARVDYRAIELEPAAINLGRAGMALTLNGIAPGYVADRIVELLKNEGFDSVLADLGEIRATGTRDGTNPWRAMIADPGAAKPGADRRLGEQLLRDEALATSAPGGFTFEPAGRFHHIFDPRTGTCPQHYASVSVVAPTATVADALATAFLLVPVDAMAPILRAAGARRATLLNLTGDATHVDA